MGVSLAEALGQVDLEAGQIYGCQAKGRGVELHVMEPAEMGAARFDASDVMLDTWLEFPLPASNITVVGEYGPLPLADVPKIPQDEDAM